jgi:hypothetical protein
VRKRRREEEREPEQGQLARLDATTRAGVLEELQRASGNRALRDVVTGGRLQRDATTTPAKPGTGSTQRAAATAWVLSVEGTVVGSLGSVEGGSIRSEVVEEPVGAGRVSRKHIGSVQYEPFVLGVGLGLGKGLFEWIAAAIDRQVLRKDVILHQVDPESRRETGRLELIDCLLTSVRLPQLGPDEKRPGWIDVTIAPGAVKRQTGSDAQVGTKQTPDPLSPSTARLEISGIGPVSGLTSLAPWTFARGVEIEEHGRHLPTKADLGNLLLTLGEGTAGFDDWVDKSMVKGEREGERTAVLSVSSKGGRKLELSFSGVGIFSAEQIAGAGVGGRRYGLFVERATLRLA